MPKSKTRKNPKQQKKARASLQQQKRYKAEQKELDELIQMLSDRQYQEAVEKARIFTKRSPKQIAGWNVLASGLQAMGQLDEAKKIFEEALELAPLNADLHSNFAILLQSKHLYPEAKRHAQKAIEIKPELDAAHLALGNIMLATHHLEEAVQSYRRTIELNTNAHHAYSNLGAAYFEQKLYAESEEACRHALRIAPKYINAEINLANTLDAFDKSSEALEVYQRLIQRVPGNRALQFKYANALSNHGQLDESETVYKMILNAREDCSAYYGLSRLRKMTKEDEFIDSMERVAKQSELTTDEQILIHYALGKTFADLDKPAADTFEHFFKASSLQRNSIQFDIKQEQNQFEIIKQQSDAAWFENNTLSSGVENETQPIFIVGMPRSGTTLVEQILATHPQVNDAGERSEITYLTNKISEKTELSYPQSLSKFDKEAIQQLSDEYRRAVLQPRNEAGIEFITDKMPSNFYMLGLIASAFPDAPLIHVKRSPLATCWSCYMLFFGEKQPWSYDLEEMGQYYAAYDDLMSHWRQILPAGRLLEVEYEKLVQQPETEVKRILEHAKLPWHPECLDFHQSDNVVKTASRAQVRQPIYTSSIKKWAAYETQLAPLISALGPLAETS